MRAVFAIKAWAAVAPGLQNQAQWLQWAQAPACPVGVAEVDLAHVPPMSRRRLGLLAKMAVSVADAVLPSGQGVDIPVVWASRYGDAEKMIALLKSQAQQEPLSPTAFGLSVHNGVGAQYSILRGVRANAVCVASSHCAPEAGVVEAVSLLQEEGREVMLVCYDQPLASEYAAFHDEPVADYAWSLLLEPLRSGCEGFALQALDADSSFERDSSAAALPHGLDVLHFLLQAHRKNMVCSHAAGQWLWERVHA